MTIKHVAMDPNDPRLQGGVNRKTSDDASNTEKSNLLIKYCQQRKDIDDSFKHFHLETNFWQISKYSELYNKFNFGSNSDLSIDSMIANQEKKMNSLSRRSKKAVATAWNSFRRSMSFFDLFTDLRLLYLVSTSSGDPIISFIIVLSVSLVCPYFVSYSCGVKLFFINRDNNYDMKNLQKSNSYDGYVALKKIIAFLSLSPIGVFYYLFLDLIDIVFVYYKLFIFLFRGKSENDIKLLEEMVSNQLGMTRMDYEGIKRQRATATLMFKTIPQATIQLLLLWNVFEHDDSLEPANVQPLDVYLSITTAILNSIFQVLRLRLESRACNETFNQYCLECLLARISWIPFEKHISAFLNGTSEKDTQLNKTFSNDVAILTEINAGSGETNINGNTSNPATKIINYNINYNYPCGISQTIGYAPKVEFDFSSMTIQKLISTINLSKQDKNRHLQINFGKSLRLINFGNLMSLFESCVEKGIEIIGTYVSSL